MTASLGFLGPRGTFSEEAALVHCRGNGSKELKEFTSIEEVCDGVASGTVDEGIVPLENSLEGGVGATLDALVQQEGIFIAGELIYPVRHCLMARQGSFCGDIRTVYSHPHALGQCRLFLRGNLPQAVYRSVESTAAAAALAAGEGGAAAVAPARAAALYGLAVLAAGIQDHPHSATRFVILAHADHPPTGKDKTSLVLAGPDGPGSLHRILGFFARRRVNLTRIESRPSRRSLGDYLFFIDCQGHRRDPGLEHLFRFLRREVSFLKVLGSYPRAEEGRLEPPVPVEAALISPGPDICPR